MAGYAALIAKQCRANIVLAISWPIFATSWSYIEHSLHLDYISNIAYILAILLCRKILHHH